MLLKKESKINIFPGNKNRISIKDPLKKEKKKERKEEREKKERKEERNVLLSSERSVSDRKIQM